MPPKTGRNNRCYQFELTPNEPIQVYQIKNVNSICGIEAVHKDLSGDGEINNGWGTGSSLAQFKVKLENIDLFDNFVDAAFYHPAAPRINEGNMYHEITRNAANITVEARNLGVEGESVLHVLIHFNAMMGVQ